MVRDLIISGQKSSRPNSPFRPSTTLDANTPKSLRARELPVTGVIAKGATGTNESLRPISCCALWEVQSTGFDLEAVDVAFPCLVLDDDFFADDIPQDSIDDLLVSSSSDDDLALSGCIASGEDSTYSSATSASSTFTPEHQLRRMRSFWASNGWKNGSGTVGLPDDGIDDALSSCETMSHASCTSPTRSFGSRSCSPERLPLGSPVRKRGGSLKPSSAYGVHVPSFSRRRESLPVDGASIHVDLPRRTSIAPIDFTDRLAPLQSLKVDSTEQVASPRAASVDYHQRSRSRSPLRFTPVQKTTFISLRDFSRAGQNVIGETQICDVGQLAYI